MFNRKTRWVWDGNVPLHEWNEVYTKDFTEEKGEFYSMKPSQTTTWLFEEGTFVPNGKLIGEENFSIQSNYLGTLEVMYAADGKVVWSAELDAYGDVQELIGERTDCPFRFQGQYEDEETRLYYNWFRYYSAEEGMYISQDPIRLASGEPNIYSYIDDPNVEIDIYGLISKSCYSVRRGVTKAKADLKKNGFNLISEEVTMIVNKNKIRADIVAEKDGTLYVFEVKNESGRLTKNQKGSGVFNKGAANTKGGLGGGQIKPSKGTQGTVDIDTKNPDKNKAITDSGFKTSKQNATFHVLKY